MKVKVSKILHTFNGECEKQRGCAGTSPPSLSPMARDCLLLCILECVELWPHAPAEIHSLCAMIPRACVNTSGVYDAEHTRHRGPRPGGANDVGHAPAATPCRCTGWQGRSCTSGPFGPDVWPGKSKQPTFSRDQKHLIVFLQDGVGKSPGQGQGALGLLEGAGTEEGQEMVPQRARATGPPCTRALSSASLPSHTFTSSFLN